jgi:DNA-binding transcriptional MerR regulator
VKFHPAAHPGALLEAFVNYRAGGLDILLDSNVYTSSSRSREGCVKIGELAKRTGLTPHVIRFYEAAGLLPDPPRTASRYRIYTEAHLARLTFILKAKRVGLSLEDVKGVLQLHDRHQATCVHVRSLLEDKLAQVERAIQDLHDFRDELERLKEEGRDLFDCRPLGGNICAIIEGSRVSVPEGVLDRIRETSTRR